VVGDALLNAGVRHAFFWSPSISRSVDLGTLGGTATQVAGINDAGQVIGASFLAGNFIEHAFVWTSAGGMADLGTLGTQQSMATRRGPSSTWARWAGRCSSDVRQPHRLGHAASLGNG
jgi:probable HAF family extracellular repeat protein